MLFFSLHSSGLLRLNVFLLLSFSCPVLLPFLLFNFLHSTFFPPFSLSFPFCFLSSPSFSILTFSFPPFFFFLFLNFLFILFIFFFFTFSYFLPFPFLFSFLFFSFMVLLFSCPVLYSPSTSFLHSHFHYLFFLFPLPLPLSFLFLFPFLFLFLSIHVFSCPLLHSLPFFFSFSLPFSFLSIWLVHPSSSSSFHFLLIFFSFPVFHCFSFTPFPILLPLTHLFSFDRFLSSFFSCLFLSIALIHFPSCFPFFCHFLPFPFFCPLFHFPFPSYFIFLCRPVIFFCFPFLSFPHFPFHFIPFLSSFSFLFFLYCFTLLYSSISTFFSLPSIPFPFLSFSYVIVHCPFPCPVGYRIRLGSSTDKKDTGRLHVDFAQARDDLYEWECRQRMLAREERHRRRVEEDLMRPPSPPPIVHFSEHECSQLGEKLKGGTRDVLCFCYSDFVALLLFPVGWMHLKAICLWVWRSMRFNRTHLFNDCISNLCLKEKVY